MRSDAEDAPQGGMACAATGPQVRVEPQLITIEFCGRLIAQSNCALRVGFVRGLPLYLLPRGDVRTEFLRDLGATRSCDVFGEARCWSIVVDDAVAEDAAWTGAALERAIDRRLIGRIAFDPAAVATASVGPARADTATDYAPIS